MRTYEVPIIGQSKVDNKLIDINGQTIQSQKTLEEDLKEIGYKVKCRNEELKKEPFSFITSNEEKLAKELVASHLEELGFPRGTPCPPGVRLAVKVYVRPEEISVFTDENGERKAIYLPKSVSTSDRYKSWVGLVIAMGPDCYKGHLFEEPWLVRFARIFFDRWMPKRTKYPYCKVGDWVVFPRNEGTQIDYLGTPIQYILDSVVMDVVQDPRHVTRN